MPTNDEVKAKSARTALSDLSNRNKNGRFSSKSVNVKKKFLEKVKENEAEMSVRVKEEEREDDESLDRLLVVQSNLASLTRKIDELVVQAINHKGMSKQGRKEIESFTSVLSKMLSVLQPWVPRLQEVFSNPSMQPEKELGHSLASKTASSVNEEEQFDVESPEQTKLDTLISPSPLVCWRADSDVERGRQLFLLTPLPMSGALSSKQKASSKSAFERIDFDNTGLPSLLNISRESNGNLLECAAVNPTPTKPSEFVVAVTENMLVGQFVSSPVFQKKDQSALVMTPFLKMSPPKSCILLEPVSESCHLRNAKVHKSTPFPVGIHDCSDSETSESSGGEFRGLALKYPELLGIQQSHKSGIAKKCLESSPDWSFSPPKSCVLLEPPDEKQLETVGSGCNLPSSCAFSQQANKFLLEIDDVKEPVGGNTVAIESTPLCMQSESTYRTGKRPGENTLKKELWTKFEAASSIGLHYNASAFQRSTKKGFLDMLDEVSCDG